MYRWDDHTSELELRIEADTEEEVFAEALAAMSELLGPDEVSGTDGARVVEVEASAGDRPALLAAWIEELVYLAETAATIPRGLEEIELDEGSVRARVGCVRGEARPLVKAVTYHRLALEQGEGGWWGRVVLDV